MTEQDGLDLVRTVFPDADATAALYILWNSTGFPGFWRIPEDGATGGECCLKQLEAARDEVCRGWEDV
jgi:hypothetical protein